MGQCSSEQLRRSKFVDDRYTQSGLVKRDSAVHMAALRRRIDLLVNNDMTWCKGDFARKTAAVGATIHEHHLFHAPHVP